MDRREVLRWACHLVGGLGLSQLAACRSAPSRGASSATAQGPEPGYVLGTRHLIFGDRHALLELDPFAHTVHALDEEGEVCHSFGSLGQDADEFNFPLDAFVRSDGQVVVLDHGNSRVLGLSLEQERVRPQGAHDTGNGLHLPRGLAWTSDAHYVCDTLQHELHIYAADGALRSVLDLSQLRFGRALGGPCGLSVDASGALHLIGRHGDEVVVLSESGERLRSYGVPAEDPAALQSPSDILVDDAGRVHVADSLGRQLLCFSPAGELLARHRPTSDALPAPLEAHAPLGLARMPGGAIYVRIADEA